MYRAQMMPHDVGANLPSLARPSILIEAVVDTAEYPSIVDVVGYLGEVGVMEGYVH